MTDAPADMDENGEPTEADTGGPESPATELAIADADLAEIVESFSSNPDLVAQMIIQQAGYSGPIPPPSALAAYEEVLPGSAERILNMAEREQQHRHDIIERTVRLEGRLGPMGMIFAFIIAITFFVVAAWLIDDGHGTEGTILATVDLLALVTVFVTRGRGESS